MYDTLLKAHLVLVALNLMSFTLRTCWAYFRPTLLDNQLALKAHKLLTLLLLLSAILLCISVNQFPFADAWLTEKLLLLSVYVAAALMAFKPRLAPKVRSIFVAVAIVSFVLMLVIAKTHSSLML